MNRRKKGISRDKELAKAGSVIGQPSEVSVLAFPEGTQMPLACFLCGGLCFKDLALGPLRKPL